MRVVALRGQVAQHLDACVQRARHPQQDEMQAHRPHGARRARRAVHAARAHLDLLCVGDGQPREQLHAPREPHQRVVALGLQAVLGRRAELVGAVARLGVLVLHGHARGEHVPRRELDDVGAPAARAPNAAPWAVAHGAPRCTARPSGHDRGWLWRAPPSLACHQYAISECACGWRRRALVVGEEFIHLEHARLQAHLRECTRARRGVSAHAVAAPRARGGGCMKRTTRKRSSLDAADVDADADAASAGMRTVCSWPTWVAGHSHWPPSMSSSPAPPSPTCGAHTHGERRAQWCTARGMHGHRWAPRVIGSLSLAARASASGLSSRTPSSVKSAGGWCGDARTGRPT